MPSKLKQTSQEPLGSDGLPVSDDTSSMQDAQLSTEKKNYRLPKQKTKKATKKRHLAADRAYASIRRKKDKFNESYNQFKDLEKVIKKRSSKFSLSLDVCRELTFLGVQLLPLLQDSPDHRSNQSFLAGQLVKAAIVGRSQPEHIPNAPNIRSVLHLDNLGSEFQDKSNFIAALIAQGIPLPAAKQISATLSRRASAEISPTAAFAEVISQTWQLAQSENNEHPSILKLRMRLPNRAPEIYSMRLNKSENAVEFLQRVWGSYIEAGILFQDDIKRLGDPKLVQAVRNYCHAKQVAASSFLPPPQKARLDRISESAPNGSAEAELARTKLITRERMKQSRAKKM